MRIVLIASMLVLVSACDRPNADPLPTGPSNAGTLDPDRPIAPERIEIPALPLISGDMPPAPVFANSMLGRRLDELELTITDKCTGNFDGFTGRYEGERSGVRGHGWGWDDSRMSAYSAFIAVDDSAVVRGASEDVSARPDVIAALPGRVTTEMTGWAVDAQTLKGGVTVYGVDLASSTACKLGFRPIPF